MNNEKQQEKEKALLNLQAELKQVEIQIEQTENHLRQYLASAGLDPERALKEARSSQKRSGAGFAWRLFLALTAFSMSSLVVYSVFFMETKRPHVDTELRTDPVFERLDRQYKELRTAVEALTILIESKEVPAEENHGL